MSVVPNKKIIQSWRCEMKGWPRDHFSKATFSLKRIEGGTRLTFTQSSVPAQCYKSIKQGWIDYYWIPMKEMFKK